MTERGAFKLIRERDEARAEVARLRRLATEATNGWACYARRKIEHDDIARLHREIAQPPAAIAEIQLSPEGLKATGASEPSSSLASRAPRAQEPDDRARRAKVIRDRIRSIAACGNQPPCSVCDAQIFAIDADVEALLDLASPRSPEPRQGTDAKSR